MPGGANWEPEFGRGLNVIGPDGIPIARASGQGAQGVSPSGFGVVYTDPVGRRAQLEGLSADEVAVLKQKHNF